MAQELTTHRSLDDLAQMISSPALLRLRRISIGTAQWPGQPMRTYLAGGLTLTDEERALAAKALARLKRETTSTDDPDARKARLGLVAKMLLSYPIAGASTESGRARAESYLDALDDVPPWAVAAAVRCWNRGAAGDHDYRWAPAPAVLRQVATAQLATLMPTVVHLENLLAAVSPEEAVSRPATPEEHGYVRDGFAKLRADLTGFAQPEPLAEAAE